MTDEYSEKCFFCGGIWKKLLSGRNWIVNQLHILWWDKYSRKYSTLLISKSIMDISYISKMKTIVITYPYILISWTSCCLFIRQIGANFLWNLTIEESEKKTKMYTFRKIICRLNVVIPAKNVSTWMSHFYSPCSLRYCTKYLNDEQKIVIDRWVTTFSRSNRNNLLTNVWLCHFERNMEIICSKIYSISIFIDYFRLITGCFRINWTNLHDM